GGAGGRFAPGGSRRLVVHHAGGRGPAGQRPAPGAFGGLAAYDAVARAVDRTFRAGGCAVAAGGVAAAADGGDGRRSEGRRGHAARRLPPSRPLVGGAGLSRFDRHACRVLSDGGQAVFVGATAAVLSVVALFHVGVTTGSPADVAERDLLATFRKESAAVRIDGVPRRGVRLHARSTFRCRVAPQPRNLKQKPE